MLKYTNLILKETNELHSYAVIGLNGKNMAVNAKEFKTFMSNKNSELIPANSDTYVKSVSANDNPQYITSENYLLFALLTQNIGELDLLVGDELLKEVTNSYILNKRNAERNGEEWINDEPLATKKNIFMLNGVRRTGKTEICKQLIYYASIVQKARDLQCAYIIIQRESTIIMHKLIGVLDALYELGYNLLVIDEITYINSGFDALHVIADARDYEVVITGTNSAVLSMSTFDTLYDRAINISTSYIGFKEYQQLFKNATIDAYIRNGCILSASSAYEQSHLESTVGRIVVLDKSYISSAFVNNILHTFKNSTEARCNFKLLTELADNTKLFERFIYVQLANFSLEITKEIFERTFEEPYISLTLKNLSVSKRSVRRKVVELISKQLPYSHLLNTEEVINKEVIEEFQRLLSQVGLLTCINGTPYLYPLGLRYIFVSEILQVVSMDNSLYALINDENTGVTVSKKAFMQKLQETATFELLEDVCRFAFRDNGYTDISKWRDQSGREIDIIINGTSLFEVKHSKQIHILQTKWLLYCYVIPIHDKPIQSYNVLYMGETVDKEFSFVELCNECYNGNVPDELGTANMSVKAKDKVLIHYINAEDFILSLQPEIDNPI